MPKRTRTRQRDERDGGSPGPVYGASELGEEEHKRKKKRQGSGNA
jgi:hypothetical protein